MKYLLLTLMLTLVLALMLTGCVTPNKWSPSDHRDMMYSCRTVCGKDLVRSYEPLTGSCECHAKSMH